MKYVAPEMEIVAIGVDTALANDTEVDFDMGDFLSKNSTPK